MLTDFFVASEQVAAQYKYMQVEDSDESDEYFANMERAEHKGLTGLELSSLWAILEDSELSLERHTMLPLPVEEEDESLTEQVPGDLTDLLAALSPSAMAAVAHRWAEVEEVQHSAEELLPILSDLKRLAGAAMAAGNHLYIWYAV